MVTSRHRLDDLDAGIRTRVDTLSPEGAAELLAAAADRSLETLGTVTDVDVLARLCGYLPLALGPVGALLTDLSTADVIAAMRTAERPLRHIPGGDRAAEAALAGTVGCGGGIKVEISAAAAPTIIWRRITRYFSIGKKVHYNARYVVRATRLSRQIDKAAHRLIRLG
jgi:hypothetical protein